MAQFEQLIPHLIKWEAGVKQKTGEGNEALFIRAKGSGWSDDPNDGGGKTMIGVTLDTYKGYCRSKGYPTPTAERLRNITYKQWLEIAKSLYWDKWRADEIRSQSVAEMVVDWTWHSGSYGIRIPQYALGVTVDGIVGSKTIAAVNGRDPYQLFETLKRERLAYIERLCQQRTRNKVYRQGWINRVNDIAFKG